MCFYCKNYKGFSRNIQLRVFDDVTSLASDITMDDNVLLCCLREFI